MTDREVGNWLQQHSIPNDPYHRGSSPACYLQFHAPRNYSKIDAFARTYYEQFIQKTESLLHMRDWGLYEQSEMIAIVRIRKSLGEHRTLIDAPGHILSTEEQETGISLFSLSASFEWSSYLYSFENHSILYNWEGEIFDYWTDSHVAMSEMKLILKHFDLPETDK